MPTIDRIPGQDTRTRRTMAGIGSDFVPYTGAIRDTDLGSFGLTTTGLGVFGNLDVDTLNFNGNVISDSTGTISFDNENLTTTGLGTFGNLDVDTLNFNGNVISDSGGTISFDDDDLTTSGTLDADGLTIGTTSGGTIADIKDEDDFASDSQTALATQQSIKAYTSTVVSAYVPYTGATTNVNLGNHNLTTTGTITTSFATSDDTLFFEAFTYDNGRLETVSSGVWQDYASLLTGDQAARLFETDVDDSDPTDAPRILDNECGVDDQTHVGSSVYRGDLSGLGVTYKIEYDIIELYQSIGVPTLTSSITCAIRVADDPVSTHEYYMLKIYRGSNNLVRMALWDVPNLGSANQVGSTITLADPASSSYSCTVRIEMDSNACKIYIDDVEKMSETLTNYSGEENIAFGFYRARVGGKAGIDDVHVTIPGVGNTITIHENTIATTSGDLVLNSTTGEISLSDDNLTTSGTLDCGLVTLTANSDVILSGTGHVTSGSEGFIVGTLTITDGSIDDTDGTIDFGDTAFTSVGDLTCAGLDASGTITLNTDSTDGNVTIGNTADRVYFNADTEWLNSTTITAVQATFNALIVDVLQPGTRIEMDDNKEIQFGNAQDATMYYDGTDLIIDSQVVGTGSIVMNGTITIEDTTTTTGQILQDGSRLFHTYMPSDQAPTYRNVFIGYGSGNFSMTNAATAYYGTGNIGIGASTLDALTTGFFNVGIGLSSLTDLTSGSRNAGIGPFALTNLTIGYSNFAMGANAGYNVTEGHDNAFIGGYAGFAITTADYNTTVGSNTLRESGNIGNCIAIGYSAGRDEDASNRLIIDNQDRGSAAATRTNAILYGVMAAVPADQTLYVNGAFHTGNATNYTEIKADGEINLHGTARIKRSVWVPFNALRAPGTRPATYVDHGISGAWEFSDAIDDTVVFNIQIPGDMDRTVVPTVTIGWSTNTAVTTETAVWQLEYLYTAAGEDTTAAAQETLTVNSNAVAQADGLIVVSFAGVDLPGASDVCLHGRLKRLGADGNDDLTDTAELHGICFGYTANKLGEAT